MQVSDLPIIEALRDATEEFPQWRDLDGLLDEARGLHIAVMIEPFLSYIMKGKKTIESRFSLRATAPYGRASVGDLVLLKAGPIVGCFRVSTVEDLRLDAGVLARLQRTQSEAICADEQFWEERSAKRFATLMGVSDVQQLPPVNIPKRDMRGWVVLRRNAAGLDRANQLELL
jgi:hypothetical protein